jgi:GT2 family glycosyltransferase
MDISVVIPCYATTEVLETQLEALAGQSFSGQWELILADNGRNPGLAARLSPFQGLIPAIRIVDATQQPGASYARNIGAAAASSEFIAFCDADDEVAPGWLAAMHAALEQHELVAAPLDYQKLNPRGGARAKLRSSARVWDYLPFLPHAVSCNMAVRKATHERIGGFDTALFAAEDIDYSWRAQLSGATLHFEPAALIHYRLRPTLWQMFRQNMRYGEATALLYRKFLPFGLPRKTMRDGVRQWLKLARSSHLLFKRRTRGMWIRQLGHTLGRLIGSIQYRVLFP